MLGHHNLNIKLASSKALSLNMYPKLSAINEKCWGLNPIKRDL